MNILERLAQAILEGKWSESPQLTRDALEAGHESPVVLQTMVRAMDVLGEQWLAGELFIPEVLIAAKAMRGGMDVLRPLLSAAGTRFCGSAVMGTVQGDVHDIGKSLVAMMLEGAGFHVVDLGVNVSPSAFVEAVKKHRPNIVGMSALLTTTLPYMRDTIQALESAGLRDSVKVMIGGAAVTPTFAESIGADGYEPDGATAVAKARDLVGA